ncbi:MAG: CBS domain-containing protein [Nitrosomonas sp.]|jgi:CBS-domain-containing membrane protein|uniref:CBS domain-containing protein n=1 Tax=Nitrosomonas sp. TaxID=42353 RepID=UPI00271FA0C4|nr:CBS domain-containing protein [Nitrosomonas sp.]MBK6959528.1 CBS domain-containing protein [Nitrosomonas sp.]MDO8894747.1 CBS domain-containing protein [Nitrosomonas sp.]MDP1548943.1 CBS domain-containing protein [Nitrosomonas sp.]MDP1934858.1 CBS domain-containing protein [Nitrosomonas sp.]MDP3279756.1 CBS domain-containing protein [Nitrosomonas sp.]
MMNEYKSLPVQYLTGTVQISKPASPNSVTLESPASEVMTDLRKLHAAVIAPNITMEVANNYMMHRGVRTLLVMHDDNSLAGIITATDILGEKPMRFIQERGIKHSEILVQDMMTPLEKLEAIPLEEVAHARVGNIVSSLRESDRLHALVIDENTVGLSRICGIFSWTQIEKQLGTVIPPNKVAKSFAEIESTLIAS